MAEKGRVINTKENLAVVKLRRTEACAKCRGCIAGMKKDEMLVEAENLCDAKVNDWVELELRENGFLSAVLIMYGIPLVFFIVGIFVGYMLISPLIPGLLPEITSLIFGCIGLALASLWIRSREDKWKQKKYRPVAARITEPDPDVELEA
ncbi:MAG: SoxR reducing system RseC family protein [Firmicutes bacterium]|nr:SoxR reducing system RseC family protein [Bacillota bacterium]